MSTRPPQRLRTAVAVIDVRPADRVLEIGCGRGDVEILHHDRAVGPGQGGGEFVQAVFSLVGDPGMQPGHLTAAVSQRFDGRDPVRRSGP